MTKKKIEELVTKFATPIVDKHSFELVDVEFIKERSNYFLRIYIDKPGGITIDDCKIVSEEISDILDREDPIPQKYFLEVSSPGLDRPLKKDSDFERFKGEMVEIKLFKPIDDKKIFEGKLLGHNSSVILIEKENGEKMEFERDKIALVRRLIKF